LSKKENESIKGPNVNGAGLKKFLVDTLQNKRMSQEKGPGFFAQQKCLASFFVLIE